MALRARTTPRKVASQARSKHTVEAILRATARILVKHGYDHASTNRIAIAAGVSIGSLYQYFPSKEAIVAALVERHANEMMALLLGAAQASVGLPLDQAARRIIEAMLDAHRVDPALHKVFVEQLPRLGGLQRVHRLEEEGLALLRTYLELHRAEIGVADLDTAAFVLMHAVEAITHGAIVLHPELFASERLVDETTAMVVRYLKG